MNRIKVNISSFPFPRITMENFSFTREEEEFLNTELKKLDLMFLNDTKEVFSVSKQDGQFSGNIKWSSSEMCAYGNDSSAIGLFLKLSERLKERLKKTGEVS